MKIILGNVLYYHRTRTNIKVFYKMLIASSLLNLRELYR